MSSINQRILADNLKKSISNYEELTLPQYTLESVSKELSKGEKLFFTKKSLLGLKDCLQKSENFTNLPDFSKLEKIVVNKGETTEFGYFLPIGEKGQKEPK